MKILSAIVACVAAQRMLALEYSYAPHNAGKKDPQEADWPNSAWNEGLKNLRKRLNPCRSLFWNYSSPTQSKV